MTSLVRFIALATASLGSMTLACSSETDAPAPMLGGVPPLTPAPSETNGGDDGNANNDGQPPSTPAVPGTVNTGNDGSNGDMMIGGVLQPGVAEGGSGGGSATPQDPSAAGSGGAAGAAGSDGVAGAAGDGSGGAINEAPGEVLGPGLSGLPVPNAGGIPEPSGAPGNLRVLPWAGFRAAISYTFDDSNQSQIANYDALNGLGVPMTFYLQTNKPESQNAVWVRALADGHELGNHSQSHLGSGNAAQLGADIDAATAFIEGRFDIEVYTMAAPNGFGGYADVARTRFLINRGVADQQIQPNATGGEFNLPCFIPATNAPASAFNAKVDAIRQNGTWQTVLVHGFNGFNDFAFQPVSLQAFLDAVNYAKSFGDVWIDTVLEVGAYWLGQRAFNAAAPTSSDGRTTWTWTLPANFPPGKFLRVVVDGGTLTQDGARLAWDDHGYYEVSLDRGSLTLSP